MVQNTVKKTRAGSIWGDLRPCNVNGCRAFLTWESGQPHNMIVFAQTRASQISHSFGVLAVDCRSLSISPRCTLPLTPLFALPNLVAHGATHPRGLDRGMHHRAHHEYSKIRPLLGLQEVAQAFLFAKHDRTPRVAPRGHSIDNQRIADADKIHPAVPTRGRITRRALTPARKKVRKRSERSAIRRCAGSPHKGRTTTQPVPGCIYGVAGHSVGFQALGGYGFSQIAWTGWFGTVADSLGDRGTHRHAILPGAARRDRFAHSENDLHQDSGGRSQPSEVPILNARSRGFRAVCDFSARRCQDALALSSGNSIGGVGGTSRRAQSRGLRFPAIQE
jgi:hypothetical protein